MVTRKGEFHVFTMACRNAQQVFLVGDFNQWSTTSTPMELAGENLWQLELKLPPGEYRFGYFVINAAWFTDEDTLGATWMQTDRLASKLVVQPDAALN